MKNRGSVPRGDRTGECAIGSVAVNSRPMNDSKETPDFEGALKTLEGLVEQMERGELSLEQSLQCFEQGIRLTRECQKALNEAEQRVDILLGKDADAEPEPFGEAGDESAD